MLSRRASDRSETLSRSQSPPAENINNSAGRNPVDTYYNVYRDLSEKVAWELQQTSTSALDARSGGSFTPNTFTLQDWVASTKYLQQTRRKNSASSTLTGAAFKHASHRSATVLMPYLVLDAVGFQDDFYLSLLDTFGTLLAIALGSQVHIRLANSITTLSLPSLDTSVTFLSAQLIAIGTEIGTLEIWDFTQKKKVSMTHLNFSHPTVLEPTLNGRSFSPDNTNFSPIPRINDNSMPSHTTNTIVQNRIPVLKRGESPSVVYGGLRSGSLFGVDIRLPTTHHSGSIPGGASLFLKNVHQMELCGLAMQSSQPSSHQQMYMAGEPRLATGGNDNILRIWDLRHVKESHRGVNRPLFHLEDHQAAIRALVS